MRFFQDGMLKPMFMWLVRSGGGRGGGGGVERGGFISAKHSKNRRIRVLVIYLFLVVRGLGLLCYFLFF